MADLQPYDPRALCPKCGFHDIRTLHHPSSHEAGCVLKGLLSEPTCCKTEHMDRLCRRCLFKWAEAPATRPAEPLAEWVALHLADVIEFARKHDRYDDPQRVLLDLTVEIPQRLVRIIEGDVALTVADILSPQGGDG